MSVQEGNSTVLLGSKNSCPECGYNTVSWRCWAVCFLPHPSSWGRVAIPWHISIRDKSCTKRVSFSFPISCVLPLCCNSLISLTLMQLSFFSCAISEKSDLESHFQTTCLVQDVSLIWYTAHPEGSLLKSKDVSAQPLQWEGQNEQGPLPASPSEETVHSYSFHCKDNQYSSNSPCFVLQVCV